MLFFQGEGLSDQVSQGHGGIVEKRAGIRALTVEGPWGRARWESSFCLLSPSAGPGQGAVGTEGLWQGAPSGPGTHPAGWMWREVRWLGCTVPGAACPLWDSGRCHQTLHGVGLEQKSFSKFSTESTSKGPVLESVMLRNNWRWADCRVF